MSTPIYRIAERPPVFPCELLHRNELGLVGVVANSMDDDPKATHWRPLTAPEPSEQAGERLLRDLKELGLPILDCTQIAPAVSGTPTPMTDGTERLCRLVYSRNSVPSDWLGGSEARILHDAAELIAALRTELTEAKAGWREARDCGQKVDDQLVSAQADVARFKEQAAAWEMVYSVVSVLPAFEKSRLPSDIPDSGQDKVIRTIANMEQWLRALTAERDGLRREIERLKSLD